jgi:4-hydroxybenzoate polyprenyltransferase
MTTATAVRRTHRWLLVLPFVWQVALVPWSNGVALRPFGLPFPMAWQMLGIVATTLVIAAVYVLDRRVDAAEGRDADAPGSDGESPPTQDAARRGGH